MTLRVPGQALPAPFRAGDRVNPSRAVVRLTGLTTVLALIMHLAGLFLGGGNGPSTFTTLHGQPITLYGHGLYQFDTLLVGSGFRGQDAAMLLLGVPLLLLALASYRAGSWRGALLLAGTLAYTLYISSSVAFGAAYNAFFPVSIALFAASLFGLMALLTSLDARVLTAQLTRTVPRRAAATFLFVVGAVLLVVWGGLSLLPALLAGRVPEEVASYTTLVTHTLDLGVIVPATFFTGVLLRRQTPLGDLLAPTLLVMSTLLGLTIAAATVAQALAGYPYTAGQLVTLVAPFGLLSLAGLALTLAWFRHLPEPGGTT